MKTQFWQRLLCAFAASAALIGGPGVAMAADADLDGIDDSVEVPGGAGIQFAGTDYLPCATGTPTPSPERNRCLSHDSKDIFIYLVRPAGGFIATAPFQDNPAMLFDFITRARTDAGTGKVNGLGVGVHVAFRTTVVAFADRGVGTLGQKAVQIIADESPESFVFGAADQGTPSDTGDATVWPVKIKNYVVSKGGAEAVWVNFIKRTFSHELGHVAALTALANSQFGGHHYATGSGVVMDQSVVYNSKKRIFTIYDDYATGDAPCLLLVDTSNPLGCIGFSVIP